MEKDTIIPLVLLCLILLPSLLFAVPPHIIGPTIVIESNDIILSSGITNVKELEKTISQGGDKEIAFTFELLKSWKFWPDEFIVSKKIVRIIRYDILRDQYWISSDSADLSKQSVNSFNTLRESFFSVEDLKVANLRELDAGDYYIRMIVESRSINEIPVIGFFMHLIPEIEMSIVKETEHFRVKRTR